MLAKKTRPEDRAARTPKPELLGGAIRDKAAPPPGLKPGEKRRESDSILDELEFVDGEPVIDLNREQQS
jgi:hypothetical protein